MSDRAPTGPSAEEQDRPAEPAVELVDGMGDDAIPKPPPKRQPVPRPKG